MKKIGSVEHVWSLICSRSTIDSETNNLSLFNVIERITVNIPVEAIEKAKISKAKGFLTQIDFEVVSRFRKITENKIVAFDVRLRLLSPDSRILMTSVEQRIAMREGIKNMRVRNRFNSLPVEKSGDYMIVVDIKEVEEAHYAEVGRIPLEILVNIEEKAENKKTP